MSLNDALELFQGNNENIATTSIDFLVLIVNFTGAYFVSMSLVFKKIKSL